MAEKFPGRPPRPREGKALGRLGPLRLGQLDTSSFAGPGGLQLTIRACAPPILQGPGRRAMLPAPPGQRERGRGAAGNKTTPGTREGPERGRAARCLGGPAPPTLVGRVRARARPARPWTRGQQTTLRHDGPGGMSRARTCRGPRAQSGRGLRPSWKTTASRPTAVGAVSGNRARRRTVKIGPAREKLSLVLAKPSCRRAKAGSLGSWLRQLRSLPLASVPPPAAERGGGRAFRSQMGVPSRPRIAKHNE